MLFSQTSLPQALLINKLRAKCPGSCFWHLSWNSYIVFLPLPSYFAPETMKRSYAGILQYFKQFFSTDVHEVPKVRSFWAEKKNPCSLNY